MNKTLQKIILIGSLLAALPANAAPNPTYTPFVTDSGPGLGYFGNDVNAVFITDDSQLALLLQKATTNPATTAGVNFAGSFPASLVSISFAIDPAHTDTFTSANSPKFLITDTKGNKYAIALSDLIKYATNVNKKFKGTTFTFYACYLSKIPLANMITVTGEKALANPPASISLKMDHTGLAVLDFIYLNSTLTLPKP